jgi:hypothetical protein
MRQNGVAWLTIQKQHNFYSGAHIDAQLSPNIAVYVQAVRTAAARGERAFQRQAFHLSVHWNVFGAIASEFAQ